METPAKQSLTPRVLSASILTLAAAGMISTANAQNPHEFVGGNDDGREPYGSLTLSGSTLYGMTCRGGDSDYGVIFKMGTDGSSYTNLHKFAGRPNDGRRPYGSLTLSGSTLYGMTSSGGSNNQGVIFRMNTDGSSYVILHGFTGGSGDGRYPRGDLTLSGSTLYGMARFGGGGNGLGYGVIFKIDTNGSSYTILHKFVGRPNDGRRPYGSLTLSGSTLYGMTSSGGSNNQGVIFRMNTDGSSYAILHGFTGGSGDGRHPRGDLTLSGSTLYGMTRFGGRCIGLGYGVIFKMDIDGSSYTNLHEFAGQPDDGCYPCGSLILSASSLAGMTSSGGNNSQGVIFRMNTDGSSHTNLHDFAGGSGDGRWPLYSALVEVGGYYYGMTYAGGANNCGVVFKQVVPEPTVFVFALIAAGLLLKVRSRGV